MKELPRTLPIFLVAVLCWPAAAWAYIDLAPTLSKVISDSKKIAVVEVVQFSREKQVVVLKEVRALKGELSAETIRQQVASAQGGIARPVLQWAGPGARAVAFVSGNVTLVCVGPAWYQVHAQGNGWWKLGVDRPDLPLAFHGSVTRLAAGVEQMLAGRDAVLTTVAYGANDEGASFDLALNRTNLPGLVKVQRIRANLKMPAIVMAASSNPAYFVAAGAVDEADLPGLMEKLKSSDPAVRAEAADDLRLLGVKAAGAEAELGRLLGDAAPAVRLAAAAALLRINPKAARAADVLAAGLEDPEPAVRRDAARAAGLAGPAAGPLASRLAGLLKGADEPVRLAALQAVSLLGPAAAAAVEAVAPLLDKPDLVIDAADALGRMGTAARPALERLAGLLAAEQPAVRWAAVRAMAQIGGPGAKPAVEFMVKALPACSEVDGYNMMIYLALLGPDAAEAATAIRSARIKNPVLPTATLWAIQPDKAFPWQAGGGGRFGGPPIGGGGEGPDFARLIYESYVRELGERLRPVAHTLAGRIMDGTAGDVPAWGYKILACGGQDVLDFLSPNLADGDIVKRERATVALGYMGSTAAPVRPQVQAALTKAPTLREQRLIAWCLREIAGSLPR